MYDFTTKRVEGQPKQDDVAPHLALALQSNEAFVAILHKKKVTAKRWYEHFADLIVSRTWEELVKGDKADE